MPIENMKRISETETQAASIRKTAAADARAIAAEAKKQAEQIVEQAHKDADTSYKAAMDVAEQEATAAFDAHLADVGKECGTMKNKASNKLPEAVQLIMGKVVNTSGSC